MTLNDYLSLIPSAHSDKPRFLALFTAVLTQSLDLLPLIQSLTAAFNPETAEGPQLDALATQLSLSRALDESDDSLRSRLKTAVLTSHWRGTNESLFALLATLLPDAAYTDNCDLTVTVSDLSIPVPAGIRRFLSAGSDNQPEK